MNEKLTVADYGTCSEVNNFCAECGSISPSKERGQERYWRMPQEKTKKECKVAGSRSRPFKEVLEQVKRNSDTDCNAQMMRRAYNAASLAELAEKWETCWMISCLVARS